ncbi:MAG: HAD family hydrolase [Leptolyngbyaceae cyanobacterium bins.349]|nr:HAD family hydrolase [Leptolyngbyaceae cyanobacterium bins.349]
MPLKLLYSVLQPESVNGMAYLTLATDYDGTLATDGRVSSPTFAALDRWREAGRKLILITGRQLDDLQTVFSQLELFDCVVVENGAVLYDPTTQAETWLADSPPPEFVQALRDRIQQSTPPDQARAAEFERLRNLAPLATGRVIVATWTPHDRIATQLIQEMGLDLEVILNKGAVMILPTGIDKAAGLRAAMQRLATTPASVVGVGDAENDLAFLTLCGYAVAVNNALPSVKQQVDWVTSGDRGAGVEQLIDQLLTR